ncbi:hypothetical protein RB653_003109 [Dictyostelium firmibasis]|uniref:EGF-like domain-containing protein n=1 Tax=Dictyostelium firmibasis TaxID=79012 RepID=A0AAN7TYN1_9MYCE
MKILFIVLLVISIVISITNGDNNNNNNNNNNNKKHHNGKVDSYSNSREDSSLDMDKNNLANGGIGGFNSFSSNKPPPTLFEQISNRLFYHNDHFSDIGNSIQQFGEFIETLKNGNFKNQLKSKKDLKKEFLKKKKSAISNDNDSSNIDDNESSHDENYYYEHYTPSPLLSPSNSIIAQQQLKQLEKKQSRHGNKPNHQYKTINNNNNKLYRKFLTTDENGINQIIGKELGKHPISDDLDEWFENNKQQQQQILLNSIRDNNDDKKLYGSNIASVCNSGVLTTTTSLTNTCLGQVCYINEMKCNGQNITITSSTPYNSTFNYNTCQINSIYCPNSVSVVKIYDFKELYGLKQCNTIKFQCDQQYLSQCKIDDLVCDGNTQFGDSNKMFGFQCTNERLVCDGVVVPTNKYKQFNQSIANGSCTVQTYPCDSITESILDITQTCNPNITTGYKNCSVSYRVTTSSSTYCSRQLPEYSCQCPMDYMGRLCNRATPIICELNLVSPKPNCTGDNFILSQSHCFTFTKDSSPSFKFNLDCFFAVNNPTPTHNFKYWINTPNLKISKPVTWSLSSEYINFYRLFNTSMRNEYKLSKEQISGTKPVWFNSTQISKITDQYFIAKRLYTEISLITPTSSNTGGNSGSSSDDSSFSSGSIDTGSNSINNLLSSTSSTNTATLSKFFIYISDYPITSHPTPSMSKVKLAFIIIGSFLAFVLLIIAIIFYKIKLKVN